NNLGRQIAAESGKIRNAAARRTPLRNAMADVLATRKAEKHELASLPGCGASVGSHRLSRPVVVHGAATDDAPEVAGEAAGGESRTAATPARASRSRAPTCARSSWA